MIVNLLLRFRENWFWDICNQFNLFVTQKVPTVRVTASLLQSLFIIVDV